VKSLHNKCVQVFVVGQSQK